MDPFTKAARKAPGDLRTLVDVAVELDVPLRTLHRQAQLRPESFIPAERVMVGKRLLNLYDDVSIDCIRIVLDPLRYQRWRNANGAPGQPRLFTAEQERRRHCERRRRRYYLQRAAAKAASDRAEAARCRRVAARIAARLDAERAQAVTSRRTDRSPST